MAKLLINKKDMTNLQWKLF